MKKKYVITITIIICILLYISSYSIFFKENKKETTDKLNEIKQYQDIVKTKEENNYDNLSIIEEYQEKFNNKDIIAELSIPNTGIMVPVAQSNDNEYYLTHLLDKSKNNLGSVFLDYRNKLTDPKLLIYGHNSQNVYTEFHTLEKYLDYSYYKNHQDIYLQTMNDNYHYKIFSVYIASADYSHVNLNFSSEEYAKHIYWLKEQSLYDTSVNVSGYDKIIVLQTCYFEKENSYIIVVGKMINN